MEEIKTAIKTAIKATEDMLKAAQVPHDTINVDKYPFLNLTSADDKIIQPCLT